MFLIYTPEGQDPQRLEFKPGRMRLSETTRLERLYSKEAGQKRSFEEFIQDARQGSAIALRVLLFTLLAREHPLIRFEDVDPFGDELEVLFHKAELEELFANVEATPDFPDRDAYMTRLRAEIANAPDASEPGKPLGSSETSGSKARSPRPGRSTS